MQPRYLCGESHTPAGYFARRCGRCKPYKTKTVIDNVALVENGIVGNAKVTDEDELNMYKEYSEFLDGKINFVSDEKEVIL